MDGMERFRDLLVSQARKLILNWSKDEEAIVQDSFAELFGGKRRKERKFIPLGPKESLIRDLFLSFGEIQTSFERMRSIDIYIGRFPYSKRGISKGSYLEYHVENYLSEFFILRERLLNFITLVLRRYRSDSRYVEFKRVGAGLREALRKYFGPISKSRGLHIHRYRYNDQDLSRLLILENLAPNEETFRRRYELVYKDVRRKKKEWIRQNNLSLRELLDIFFIPFRKFLFTEKGNFRFPTGKMSHKSLISGRGLSV